MKVAIPLWGGGGGGGGREGCQRKSKPWEAVPPLNHRLTRTNDICDIFIFRNSPPRVSGSAPGIMLTSDNISLLLAIVCRQKIICSKFHNLCLTREVSSPLAHLKLPCPQSHP